MFRIGIVRNVIEEEKNAVYKYFPPFPIMFSRDLFHMIVKIQNSVIHKG